MSDFYSKAARGVLTTGWPGGYSYDIRGGAAEATWPSAGRCFFVRMIGYAKTITGFRILPHVQAGNVILGVYASTGTGYSTVPTGNALAVTASTSVGTADTVQDVALTASFAFDPAQHWVAMQCDSATASFVRSTVLTDTFGAGIVANVNASGTTLPTSGFTLGTNSSIVPWIGYA